LIALRRAGLAYDYVKQLPVEYQGHLLGCRDVYLILAERKVGLAAFAVRSTDEALEGRVKSNLRCLHLPLGLMPIFTGQGRPSRLRGSRPAEEEVTMKTIQREWDWWAYHYRVVHRNQIPGIGRWDDDVVELIVHALALRPGDRVLDLACGSGDHARRLAGRGLEVLGVDVASSLVAYCRERAAEEDLATARFEVGDMRALTFREEFDAVLLLSGSFGFFDDGTNRDVLARVATALKPGGRAMIDVFDPGEMMVRPPRRTWSRYGGGYGLHSTWWEPETCTYASEFMFLDADGVLNTSAAEERIRVYSLPEWRALLAGAGLGMEHALADTKLPMVAYDRDHYGNLVLVAKRGGTTDGE
jgi:SAM-dependent methyltransferase